jgi:hypothetical protein
LSAFCDVVVPYSNECVHSIVALDTGPPLDLNVSLHRWII